MRRATLVGTILVLMLAASGPCQVAEAQGRSELAGAWIVTQWETADGQTIAEPQRGLVIFTADGHYSIMYVTGDQPRAEWAGETPTDAEKVTAFDNFVANSGRYSIEGDQITYEAFMAKNPGYMANFGPDGQNARTMTFSIDNGILTLRFTNPDGGAGRTARLRRPSR